MTCPVITLPAIRPTIIGVTSSPELVAGDGEGDEDRRETRGERPGADEVDVPPGRLVHRARHGEEDEEDGRDPDGHVHVEDPAPADVVGEVPADGRADHRRDAEDATEESLD